MTATATDGRVRLVCVLEAGEDIGWGHASRARTLLEAAHPDSRILVGRGFNEVAAWAREVDSRREVAPWSALDQPMSGLPAYDAVTVVDSYAVRGSWIEGRLGHCPVAVIDDWMRPSVRADVLINPNIGASADDYPAADVTLSLCGTEFALLRNEIRVIAAELAVREHVGPARRLLVTLGASDPMGGTAQVAAVARDTTWFQGGEGRLEIVLGRSYTGPEPWTSWPEIERRHVEIVRDPSDYVRRCATADLVISGAGSTTYELAQLNCPFIPVATVDNHERIAAGWSLRAGLDTIDIRHQGWNIKLASRLDAALGSVTVRREMGRASSMTVDGEGVGRVLDHLARLFPESVSS